MDTVIKISRPEDVVAYVPFALGFRPRDSAVLVGLRAGGPGLGLTTRVDLAGLAHPDAGPQLVADVAQCLARDRCDDAFVVLYTDEPRDTLATHPAVGPALARLRELTSWADPPGPWVVGAGTYGCWGHGEHCAPGLADVTELEEGWLAATMVWHGLTVAGERSELHVPPTSDAASRRAAVRAARRAREEMLSIGSQGSGAAFGLALPSAPGARTEWREARWRGWVRLVSLAREGRELPPAELGVLAVAMADPYLRDGMLYSLVRRMPRTVPSPAMAVAVLDDVMTDGGPRPRTERVGPAETVLRAAAACLGAGSAAHPLAALAWLAWWSGDGARADVLCEQVLAASPGNRLARLVRQALDGHVAPGWTAAVGSVRRRSIR